MGIGHNTSLVHFTRAAWAFFRTLGASLYAEAWYRIKRLTFFQIALILMIGLTDVVNVPKEFQDAGFTPNVVARRINDKIREIDTEEKARTVELEPRFLELATESHLPDLQLPGAALSLKNAILFIRELLHFPPERITVDVTLDLPTIVSTAGDEKTSGRQLGAEPLRVVVERVGDPSPTVDQIGAIDPETTLFRIAQDVMFEADPLVLGAYLVENKAFARSERCFQKATKMNSQGAIAFIGWGAALESQRKYADASEKFQRATELNPKLAKAYTNWGEALSMQGRFADADSKYEQATSTGAVHYMSRESMPTLPTRASKLRT